VGAAVPLHPMSGVSNKQVPCWQCGNPTVNQGPRPRRMGLTSDDQKMKTYLRHLPVFLGKLYRNPFDCTHTRETQLYACGTCLKDVNNHWGMMERRSKAGRYLAAKYPNNGPADQPSKASGICIVSAVPIETTSWYIPLTPFAGVMEEKKVPPIYAVSRQPLSMIDGNAVALSGHQYVQT
jgi:hypothetical protein